MGLLSREDSFSLPLNGVDDPRSALVSEVTSDIPIYSSPNQDGTFRAVSGENVGIFLDLCMDKFTKFSSQLVALGLIVKGHPENIAYTRLVGS